MQYPRYRFFQETVKVFRESARVSRSLSDKHLSWEVGMGEEMYDESRSMNFPFLAGSSFRSRGAFPPSDAAEFNGKRSADGRYGGVDSL